MGIQILSAGTGDEVLDGPAIGAMQWYRVGLLTQGDEEFQAAAEFVVSDGNANANNFLRLQASSSWTDARSSLLLTEYSCWQTPFFTRARLATNAGTTELYLDLYGAVASGTTNMRLKVSHRDFRNGVKWKPQSFTPVSATGFTVIATRGLGPTGAWLAPTMGNGWVNFAGGYQEAGYTILPGSQVCLRGLIKNGTLGATVFTLPAGYRPAGTLIFPSLGGNNGAARVDVSSGGVVTVPSGTNTFITLSGINFIAEL